MMVVTNIDERRCKGSVLLRVAEAQAQAKAVVDKNKAGVRARASTKAWS
jgi:hypothetical protein